MALIVAKRLVTEQLVRTIDYLRFAKNCVFFADSSF